MDDSEYLEVFKALSNRHRLRILAELVDSKRTITDLSRRLKISAPLVFLHLRKLVKAGLVKEGDRETINRGDLPPLNKLYYEIKEFRLEVSPEKIWKEVRRWS